MLESSARLLRLLSLLEVRRDWSGSELSSRLDVDVRTVRRDVDRLRSLGYPVMSTPGANGGYRLDAGAHMPPLLLDDDEAVAVAVGLRTSAISAVAGIEESSVRALAKLERLLPAGLRQRVRGLEGVTTAFGATQATVDAEILTGLAAACRDNERLRFSYEDREGSPTTRTTEPHAVVCTGRRWYLVAWDIDRQDWRTFRADRVGAILTSGPRFSPRELPEDPAAYVRRSVSVRPWRFHARVELEAPLETLRQQVPWLGGMVSALDDERSMLETGTDSLFWLAVYLGQIDVPFKVLEPPELLDVIRAAAERLAAASATI